ncbi:MAG: glycosyltransferase [Desulfovibrionaceae bacterium]
MHSYGGGAEKICLSLAKSLTPERFTVTLGCLYAIEALRAPFQDFARPIMPASRGFKEKCKNMYTLWRTARRSDCVIGSLELQSVFWAALLAPHKAIGWLHKDLQGYCAQKPLWFRSIYLRLFAWCVRRCVCIVCASEGVRESTQQLFPALRDSFVHIRNPVEIQALQQAATLPMPDILHPTFQHAVILSVGRLVPQKAYQHLICAHALLRQRGYQHHLCILGEGPERPRLEALCRSLGVEDTVLLPGFMPPYSAMRQARVFALSSDFEGLSLVIVEALALGLPVVSTDCPSGPREVLQDGAHGDLVPVADPEALAVALGRYVAANAPPPDPRRIAQGQKRADEFDIRHCLQHWEILLRRF